MDIAELLAMSVACGGGAHGQKAGHPAAADQEVCHA
jgi:hypothetical protein